MFVHPGFRPSWPIVFFFPWLALGIAFLLQSVRKPALPASTKKEATHLGFRVRRLLAIGLYAFTSLAATGTVLGDPAPAAEPRACASISPGQASTLADNLYQKGDYQHAGECYEAAGDMEHANMAFVKATGPKSVETGQALMSQADSAKALFASVRKAIRGH
jgi:hypothetical protein